MLITILHGMEFRLKGNVAAIETRLIFPVSLTISGSSITAVERLGDEQDPALPFLLPGFIDAHVHIESSMLVPSEFARLAVVHGTVGTVSDPHEIANVCGLEGVEFMIANGKSVPFHFFFGAPSCVPATSFETAGAVLGPEEVEKLLSGPDIYYLSEMMNFPGVLQGDPDVMAKIAAARKYHKPVDGHAPGLRGDAAARYVAAGISTDHECFTLEEARDKLRLGMKILIREGSAARNFEALWPLIDEAPDRIMFCTDDMHPDSLVRGHINALCRRAVAKGCDPFNVIRAACFNPVEQYRLPVGQLRSGDPADLVVVEDLVSFNVLKTYYRGQLVAENGETRIPSINSGSINHFDCLPKTAADFHVRYPGAAHRIKVNVIGAVEGQLITEPLTATLPVADGQVQSDPARDVLKIAVVNRYREAPVSVGFIRNFGLKTGAIASSVAHDSHNIVVTGANDDDICRAVNLLIAEKGGISCVGNGAEHILALPVAGLMSTTDGYRLASDYTAIDRAARDLGTPLAAPFMTLSFMALLVIPHLKLSDRGLFDGDGFDFLPTIVSEGIS